MDTIHPILVHFPIALLTVGFFCDLIGYYRRSESLKNAGWWSLVFGFGGILLATLSGFYVEGRVGHNDAAHDIMELHKQVGLVATLLFGAMFAIRGLLKSGLPSRKEVVALYFACGLLATGVLGYGAHLGGSLVYDFGVGGKATVTTDAVTHNHDDGHTHEKTSVAPPAPEPDKVTHTHADGSKHTH